MPDTETRTRELTPAGLPTVCANCGVTLTGPYCSACGQHAADFHRSMWRFVADFFDNTICWDNKLFLTLGPLFKQPGFLTREFMRGRRVRYVHPLRMFLFTSAVCLTLLQFNQNSIIQVNEPHRSAKPKRGVNVEFSGLSPSASPSDKTPATGAAKARKPSETDGDDDDKDDDDPTAAAIKSAIDGKLAESHVDATDVSKADTNFERKLNARIAAAGGARRFGRAINDGVMNRLSWVALALLPVFAAGLRSLYWRDDRFYFEHLIFSLHYHTFLLLFWTAYVGALSMAAFLPLHTIFEWSLRLALLLPPVYLYLALRQMYGDSPRRTLVKVLILGSLHLLAIIIGVAAVGAFVFFGPGS